MKVNKVALYFLVATFLASCASSTTVNTLDTRPSLAIDGAPQESILMVDGVDVGTATDFDGSKKVLYVEPGTHRVTIRLNGKVYFEKLVFVESETKKVEVR